jgi:hypothetical protein
MLIPAKITENGFIAIKKKLFKIRINLFKFWFSVKLFFYKKLYLRNLWKYFVAKIFFFELYIKI